MTKFYGSTDAGYSSVLGILRSWVKMAVSDQAVTGDCQTSLAEIPLVVPRQETDETKVATPDSELRA